MEMAYSKEQGDMEKGVDGERIPGAGEVQDKQWGKKSRDASEDSEMHTRICCTEGA